MREATTSMTVHISAKERFERLAGNQGTRTQQMNRLLDQYEELERQYEILQDENEKLKELNGGEKHD